MTSSKHRSSLTWIIACITLSALGATAQPSSGDPESPYTLSVTALRGRTGTDVFLKVVPIPGYPIPERAESVVIKSTASEGRWSRTYSDVALSPSDSNGDGNPDCGIARFFYEDLERLMSVEVQAHVHKPASQNTEVLRGNAVVLYQPDLKVDRVDAPDNAHAGAPVQVNVVVSEIRGDVGARFNVCILEGSTELDRAENVMIDRTLSPIAMASFTLTFPVGTHVLTALVKDSDPEEYDTLNNSAVFTISVGDLTPTGYTLYYYRSEGGSATGAVNSYLYEYGAGTDYEIHDERFRSGESGTSGFFEELHGNYTSMVYLDGPLNFRLSIKADGAPAAGVEISNWIQQAWGDYRAWGIFLPDQQLTVSAYSFGSPSNPFSNFSFLWQATNSQYYSHSALRYLYTVTTVDPVTGDRVRTVITDVDFNISESAQTVQGSFVNASNSIEVYAELRSSTSAAGGSTQVHALTPGTVDTSYDTSGVVDGTSYHYWGYQKFNTWSVSVPYPLPTR